MIDLAFILKEAKTEGEAAIMREIRNESSSFMTMNKGQIGKEEQKEWWKNLDRTKLIPYLLYVMEFGAVIYPVGYGLIKVFDEHCELTAAITEKERGKGYGREIFKQLAKKAKMIKDDIILQVLESNEVARNLYESLGYKEIDRQKGVIYLKYGESNTN